MDDVELNELLNYAEAEETAVEGIRDANVTGDQQLTAERIARALEAQCNTDKALVRAIASMNQKTCLISEDIKEERSLITATHDKLESVLGLDSAIKKQLSATAENYKWKLDRVVSSQDDELKQVTKRAVHHVNKSVAVAGFLIVGFSILSAVLASVGLFFTIHFGEFFRELWQTNPFVTVFFVILVAALLIPCLVGFQKSVKSWWDSHPKNDKK